MICILLAAGYSSLIEEDIKAELSQGVSDHEHLEGVPKALLPGVGGKKILDYWWDLIKVRRLFSDVFLVTNGDKYKHFERWAMGADFPLTNIINNGCSLAGNQRGALVDLHQVLLTKRVLEEGQDVMLVAGDMMFEDESFDLTQVLDYYRSRRVDGDLALCYQLEDDRDDSVRQNCTTSSSAVPTISPSAVPTPVSSAVATTSHSAVATTASSAVATTASSAVATTASSAVATTASSVVATTCTEAAPEEQRCSRGLVEVCPETNRIVRFLEKPLWSETDSRLASVVFYCLRHVTLQLLQGYIGVGQRHLQNLTCGSFLSWLVGERRWLVYAMVLPSGFQLIGPTVRLSDYTSWLRIYQHRRCSHRPALIRHRVYARVGLMGNPSDGFYGKTISLSIENFWAEVTITESATLRLLPHPLYDPTEFGSLHDLHGTSVKEGYLGGLRLLQATCKRFYQHCSDNGLALGRRNFTLRYDTNIPRQVGLAGSSAIVTGVLRCLLQFHGISERQLPRHRLPQLVLDVERLELDIQAGLQDRVVQVYGGLVYMDFDRDLMSHRGYGRYQYLSAACLPPLFLAYLPEPSDSGRIHSDVSARWNRGDESVLAAMRQFAELTDRARDSIAAEDWSTLGQLMVQNFQLRKSIYGVECLGEHNVRMIELGTEHGASCKFPGSGGAVLGLARDSQHQTELRAAYQREGYVFSEIVPLLTSPPPAPPDSGSGDVSSPSAHITEHHSPAADVNPSQKVCSES